MVIVCVHFLAVNSRLQDALEVRKQYCTASAIFRTLPQQSMPIPAVAAAAAAAVPAVVVAVVVASC